MKPTETLPPILLVDTAEAARLLGIKKSLFYSMLSNGRLGVMPVKFNSKKLFSVEELKSWIKGGCPCREEWLQSGDIL